MTGPLRLLGTAVAAAAVAAAMAAAPLGLATTAAHASTTTPTHVAIVVDGVGTACVPWHSGMTGADVLGARFDVAYGQPTPRGNFAGMVVQIDGVPANPNPNTAYWAYFHESRSGWVYSNTGALSYRPEPGTVDGWRLDSAAHQNSHPAPAAASYAAICAGQDPTPAPTPTRSATASRPAATVSRRATRTRGPTSSSARAPSTRAAVGAVSTAHRHRPTTASAAPSTALAAATPTAAPDPPAPTPPSSPVARSHPSASGLPSWGAGAGVLVLLALGGGALWRARSRRSV